jgi:hypothetical protein
MRCAAEVSRYRYTFFDSLIRLGHTRAQPAGEESQLSIRMSQMLLAAAVVRSDYVTRGSERPARPPDLHI